MGSCQSQPENDIDVGDFFGASGGGGGSQQQQRPPQQTAAQTRQLPSAMKQKPQVPPPSRQEEERARQVQQPPPQYEQQPHVQQAPQAPPPSQQQQQQRSPVKVAPKAVELPSTTNSSPALSQTGSKSTTRTSNTAAPSRRPQQQHQRSGTHAHNVHNTTVPTTVKIASPTNKKSKSHHQRSKMKAPPRVLDDDDFSVAPGLDVEVRSVTTRTFHDVYQVGKQLGYGAFAVVFLAMHKPTKATYAIKKIDRSKMMWNDRDALKDEIQNLKLVREGPNIVQLYEVFEDEKEKVNGKLGSFCYLVMELLPGGELFDRIIEKKKFTEKEARSCTRCVLEALEYMHSQRVAHRDLKPENLLLGDPKGLTPVKLADFGFAKKVTHKNGCRTLCGTPGYLAPEILERWPSYDVKCDVWSVGVILFLLLGGYLPFDDNNEDRVFDRTRNGEYDFRPQFWRNISSGAKDLVTQCLTINPTKRVDATSALKHDWMVAGEAELGDKQLDVHKLKNVIEGRRKMKAAVTTLLAANRIKELNDNFGNYLDKRRNDSIVSHFSLMTGGTRTVATFKQDSPSGRPFNTFYTKGELLGSGASASVYRYKRKATQLSYAVKHITKSKLDAGAKATLKDEVRALKLLRGGPHIIRLYDVFDEQDNVYLILEEMKGGDLLSRIVEKEVYTEREARQVCQILLQAIDYCHKKSIAHRDIKPDNLLLVEEGDDTSIKLADFGFAKKVTGPNSLMTLCGTPQYVAPEILDMKGDGYDQRADMWSVGIVAFVLLGGYTPFNGPLEELAGEVMAGRYEFHDEYWHNVSPMAKEMIAGLLQVHPDRRMTAESTLACSWMAIEEEKLTLKDLSLSQSQMRKNLKPKEKVKMAVQAIMTGNKWLSLAGVADPARTAQPDDLESIVEEPEQIFGDLYNWGEQIGVGTFSVVHECTRVGAKETYAVKRVPRKDLHPSDAVALHDEISALRLVTDCPQIVKLHDVYDEADFTYLVLECMKGGDLIDRIIEKRHYTEYDAREVSRKLILGVAFCHKKKIANRNLKPENLLLSVGSDTDVKISDFGYAKTVTFPNSLRTQCGTEGYVAPEILEHRPAYDTPCDMWSLGVIIYIVLGGYRPFRGEGEEVMKQIRYGEYKFHKKYWNHVSSDAKKLIASMLTVDPTQRITAEAALESPWIQADNSDLNTDLSGNLAGEIEDIKSLKGSKAKLKSAVNTIIATNKLTSLGEYRAYTDF